MALKRKAEARLSMLNEQENQPEIDENYKTSEGEEEEEGKSSQSDPKSACRRCKVRLRLFNLQFVEKNKECP